MMTNGNGLDISEDAFEKMKVRDQNLILFQNLVHIRTKFSDYNLTKKIQYVWLTLLSSLFIGYSGIKLWFKA